MIKSATSAMSTLLATLLVVLFISSGSIVEALEDAKATYEFSTGTTTVTGRNGATVTVITDNGGRKTLRHRRAKELPQAGDEAGHNSGLMMESPTPKKNPAKKGPTKNKTIKRANADKLDQEEKLFWDRMLQEELGSITPAPTMAPPPCPSTTIEVLCVTEDERTPCTDVVPPAEGTGDDCIVSVEFTYAITNTGATWERIYSVVVTRGLETIIVTDIPDVIPTRDLAPGEVVVFPVVREIDVCTEAGLGAFETTATVITGPPTSVEVSIACVSEEGEECQEISQPTVFPDDCSLDVIYTYTVENIGQADFTIFEFSRTRDGAFRDLLPLLDTPFLAVADNTTVQETEEIDRCMAQTFVTSVIVRKLPPADALCQDRAFYP